MAKVERKVICTNGDDAVNDSWIFQSTTLNGKSTVRQELVAVTNANGFVVGHELKHWYKNDLKSENYDDVQITHDEAKSLRDWLVQQLPFSKQELVDLMGDVVRGGK